MRYNTFGKGTVCETLDTLLQNNPASRTVGKCLMKYRRECDCIVTIPDESVPVELLIKLKPIWMIYVDTTNWSDEIKSFTKNLITVIFRESLRKLK